MLIEIKHRYSGDVLFSHDEENNTTLKTLLAAIANGANLSGVYLFSTVGNGQEIKCLQTNRWDVAYTTNDMQIGCQIHPIEEWWQFDEYAIASMHSAAPAFWRRWKPILQRIIELSPATESARTGDDKEEATV